MLMRHIHTLCPKLATLVHAAQLPLEQNIELIDMLFRPLDARGHELLWKTLLEHIDSIFDDGEVDVRDLEDVIWEIAFEDALPVGLSARVGEEEGREVDEP
jgi:hypothetical protein